MADSKELKPKSFRITEETADKIKEISKSIDGNQQETIAKLIEAYEFQSSKNVLSNKKNDIENFEKYISIITNLYMQSLTDNENVTETVRTQHVAQLNAKDTTIADLQTERKALKEAEALAVSNFKEIKDVNEKLEKELADLKNMLLDKDKLNKELTERNTELKSKVVEMQQDKEELQKLKQELQKLKEERDTLKRDKDIADKKIEELADHEADALERLKEKLENEHNNKIIEIKQSYQEELQKLRDKQQKEIDKHQKKCFDLLQSIKPVMTDATTNTDTTDK